MKTVSMMVAASVAVGSAWAQDRFAAPPYTGNLEVNTGYSAGSDIRLGTRELGNLNATRTRLDYKGVFNPAAEFNWGSVRRTHVGTLEVIRATRCRPICSRWLSQSRCRGVFVRVGRPSERSPQVFILISNKSAVMISMRRSLAGWATR